MSLPSRILLAFVAGLSGAVMILAAPPSDQALYFYMFAGFCFLISIACITRGRIRRFVIGMIGTALFGVSVWYLYVEIITGPLNSGARSQPSIVNAVLVLIALGVPGLAYAMNAKRVSGKYRTTLRHRSTTGHLGI